MVPYAHILRQQSSNCLHNLWALLYSVALLLYPVAKLLNPVAAYHIGVVCSGIRIRLVIPTQMKIMHHRAPTFSALSL
jgi:hypothetical protein